MTTGGLVASMIVGQGDFRVQIDLDVAPGTTAALLGPNGSGKSTTLGAVAGLHAVESGRIVLGGRTLDDADTGTFVPPEHRRLGVVFQRYLLFDHLDVVDNVAFGLVAAGRRRREARRMVEPWIDRLELADLADRRPTELSGGQAQRVALARALAIEPRALLLDEPLAAVDIAARTRLRRILAEHLSGFAGPRLLVTHDPADAFLLADVVHVLEDGRITQSGPPDEIRRHPATPYVAALSGVNFLTGVNRAGRLTIDDHDLDLVTADTHTEGSVLVTISPAAVAVHISQPGGSPRNAWETTIDAVEPLGDTTRLVLAAPLPLSVDVTPAAVASLGLAPGAAVWASVKATEIQVASA